METFIVNRSYGPNPIIIPDKQCLKRAIKNLRMRARNEYNEDKRMKYRIIRDELTKLFNELY